MAERETSENVAKQAGSAVDPAESGGRQKRTRSGCLCCRRRHKKCDEDRPECQNCIARGETCEWQVKVLFKSDNIVSLTPEHPSMQHSAKRPKHYEIRDVTSEVMRDYQNDFSPATGSGDEASPRSHRRSDAQRSDASSQIQSMGRHPSYQISPNHFRSPSLTTPQSMVFTHSDAVSYRTDDDSFAYISESPASDPSQLHKEPSTSYPKFPTPSTAHTNVSSLRTEDGAAADLLALRYTSPLQPILPKGAQIDSLPQSNSQTSHMHGVEFLLSQPVMSPEDDGIFAPGSAYHELHTTLRNHIISTAKSNGPTRPGTPLQTESNFSKEFARAKLTVGIEKLDSDPESEHSHRAPELQPHREYVLWKNWIDEVAPWLDKFDNQRHFEHKVPMMAKNSPELRFSILALSARQLERKNPSTSSSASSESLMLYQEAIHLLLPVLHTKNTAVIASCVILCVLEMMSCNPREWRRHLEGCANLIEAVGINGFVGGLDQALFWCFARMDVCGGLISQEGTMIPIHHWAPNTHFEDDLKLFRSPNKSFDTYANYAVFLCAAVLHLSVAEDGPSYLDISDAVGTERQNRRWQILYDLLDNWYNQRPEEMKAILSIPVTTKDHSSPFPTVLYGNGSAVSGNQLYHTATLLLLQQKPRAVVLKKARSILWHARQICAISESNTHHGSWTNSVQPLWIAGKVMSHPSEHEAILEVYRRIERETGWATKWRMDDLREYWGDLDD